MSDKCPACDGTGRGWGYLPDEPVKDCSACGGTGKAGKAGKARQAAARDESLCKCVAAIERLRQDVVLDGGPYCRGWLDAVEAAVKLVRKLVMG